jgi:hypothetical protein
MKQEEKQQICLWIGEGERCRHPTVYGKSYCEEHYDRIYDVYLPEMANYIIEQELKNGISP